MAETKLVLGVSSCFLTRRYEDPENWIDFIKKAGFDYMSLDSDMLDPFFSGTAEYIDQFARRIHRYADRCDMKVADYLTGTASYRFLGLAHKDEAQRNRMKEWFKGAIDIAAAIGADCAGGRCDAYPVEALGDPEELSKRYGYVVEAYRELAGYAKMKGLRSIYFEQMYVPSLKPYTLDETDKYIGDLNKNLENAVPIRPVVDVGHACGQAYGISGDDLSYEKWLERFGGACRVIHLQQTRREKSDHSPFAPGYEGDVKIESAVDAIRKSLSDSADSRWRKYIEPENEILLLLEQIPSTTQNEEEVLEDLHASYSYLRRVIPKEGLTIRY